MFKSNDTLSLEKAYDLIFLRENFENVLHTLKFSRTTKKPQQYVYFQGEDDDMPSFSYKINEKERTVETHTSDGKETQKRAKPEDIIISGPSKEKYVIDKNKFSKLYKGSIGSTVTPEQSERIVARADINEPLLFKAPWGEDMILKPGDYLVKDGSEGYYRIAKKEFEETYNPL
jgi:hypothetical protein